MQEPFEIRHLRYFLEVADAGSFSRAARRLGVSQPAISQQMRDLEKALRTTLLQRRGKRTFLSPAGLLFRERAREILRYVSKSLQELSAEPNQLRGTVRLGVIPYLNVPLMPKLLGLFAQQYPAIDLSVLETSSSEIETLLEEGRMDVGFGWATRHSRNLRYEHLCYDQFMVVTAESHPWARRRVIDISELHLQRLLQLPDTYVMRRMTDEMMRNFQLRPRTVAEISSIEAILRSLGPLKAIALMPKVTLREAGHLGLNAIRLKGAEVGLEIGLLRLADSAANDSADAFARLAKSVVPKLVSHASQRR